MIYLILFFAAVGMVCGGLVGAAWAILILFAFLFFLLVIGALKQ